MVPSPTLLTLELSSPKSFFRPHRQHILTSKLLASVLIAIQLNNKFIEIAPEIDPSHAQWVERMKALLLTEDMFLNSFFSSSNYR